MIILMGEILSEQYT